jgi:hypothetical protein
MTEKLIEYPWPDCTEIERHEMLLAAENELLCNLSELSQAVQNKGAHRHIKAGLSRRLLYLQRCRILLREECAEHKTTLNPYVATDLSIYINAYYVNLCGALDNLAWTLVHELKLKDPLNEEDRDTKRLANLTAKDFLKAVVKSNPRIANRIRATLDWHKEVLCLRHPAAHRIPLTVIAGVLEPEDKEEYHRLQSLADKELKENGDTDRYFDLLSMASQLGKFYPWLENPRGYQNGFFYLPNLIARDQAFFLDLTGAVVCILCDDLNSNDPVRRYRFSLKSQPDWPVGIYLKVHNPNRIFFDQMI